MASEAVQKILAAEAESNKKNAQARQRSEDMINKAKGDSSLAIQKKISEATAESGKMRSDYDAKLVEYTSKAEEDCQRELKIIAEKAAKNMDKAADAIISTYF